MEALGEITCLKDDSKNEYYVTDPMISCKKPFDEKEEETATPSYNSTLNHSHYPACISDVSQHVTHCSTFFKPKTSFPHYSQFNRFSTFNSHYEHEKFFKNTCDSCSHHISTSCVTSTGKPSVQPYNIQPHPSYPMVADIFDLDDAQNRNLFDDEGLKIEKSKYNNSDDVNDVYGMYKKKTQRKTTKIPR